MKAWLRTLILCAWPASHGLATTDIWDLPPLRYSETPSNDPLARLDREIREGRRIEGMAPLERLRFILRQLDVPEESQILVFSKTSKQNDLISPSNPRCIYFSENAYVGTVPGGAIEAIAHDPVLGPVFYLIRGGDTHAPMEVSRDTSDCLSCHGTARTESVPGVLVRSVFSDADGHPLLALGTFDVTATTPLQERWGGYYVTGQSSLPHLGNRTFDSSSERSFPESAVQQRTLAGIIDTQRYLRPTSDIVALMVLEHQCHIHNLLNAASVHYGRLRWLQQTLDPQADPDRGQAKAIADDWAAKIVDALLFSDEADLGDDGIEGDPAFQEMFTRRFPRTSNGHSLADFHLYDRLFKNRCSYMVYSKAFGALPAPLRDATVRHLHQVLTTPPSPTSHPGIKTSERERIATILAETWPLWPKS